MKKFTLLSVLMLFAFVAFAQRNVKPLQVKALPTRTGIMSNIIAAKHHANNTMKKAPRKAGELLTPPSEGETWYVAEGSFWAWDENDNPIDAASEVSPTMKVCINGNDIYIQGLAAGWMGDGWVKGTINGSKVTIPSGQYVGTDNDGDEFIVGIALDALDDESEDIPLIDIVFDYDADKGILSLDANTGIVENGKADELYCYAFWEGLVLKKDVDETPDDPVTPDGATVVTPPAGEVESWVVYGVPVEIDEKNQLTYGEEEYFGVNVIKDGNDFYIQGICIFLEDAWLKGTIDGNKLTFEKGQFFGVLPYGGTDYPLYFLGYGEKGISDLVFTYDEENDMWVNETYSLAFTTVSPTALNYVDIYLILAIYKNTSDGINAINTKQDNNMPFYNLQGVKMNKPTQKGVYIHNGRKVIVK